MKKVLTFLCMLILIISCRQQNLEDKYFEYCLTDSVAVGYQFIIKQNDDGSFQRVNVFSPEHKDLLRKFEGLIYAQNNTIVNPKGYWHYLKTLTKDSIGEPIGVTIIKTPREPDFPGFHEWKKNKPNKFSLTKTK